MRALLITCILEKSSPKSNGSKVTEFLKEQLFSQRVLFTPCSWAQTSKVAKSRITVICGLDRSTIPHAHFFDWRHSLTFRRKKHVLWIYKGKGMNFWTTPWTFPKLLWKKMTHIKDLRFHPLVLGSLRNQFFTINAVFYMKSYTVQCRTKQLQQKRIF